MLSAKNNSAVGLHLKSSELHFMVVRVKQRKVLVQTHLICPLPKLINLQSPADYSLLSENIERCVHSTKTKGFQAIFALASQDIIAKVIKLPALLTALECKIEIQQKLAFYFPGIKEELCAEVICLGEVENDAQQVLIVAARASQIAVFSKMLHEVKLVLRHLEIDTYAFVRAINFFKKLSDTSVIIDISPAFAEIYFVEKSRILFTKNFSFGESAADTVEQIKMALNFMPSHFKDYKTDFIFRGDNTVLLKRLRSASEFPIQHLVLADKLFYEMLPAFGLALRGLNVGI